MDITLWKEVMMISYYGLHNLERGWILRLFYYCHKQRWSEISIVVVWRKGHFEHLDFEKDYYYKRTSRNDLKEENCKALGDVLGGARQLARIHYFTLDDLSCHISSFT